LENNRFRPTISDFEAFFVYHFGLVVEVSRVRLLCDPGLESRSPAWKVAVLPAEAFYEFFQILHPGVGGGRSE